MMKTSEIWNMIKMLTKDLSRTDYNIRQNFCFNWSWAIPDEDSVKEISKFLIDEKMVLEIGAGLGLWSRLLQDQGTKMVPIDIDDDKIRSQHISFDSGFTKVRLLSKQDIDLLLDNNFGSSLFLCWPSYNKDWAYQYLKKLEPNKLVFIGEDNGGCTADENFFYELHRKYEEVNRIYHKNWDGIQDSITFHVRK